MEIQWRSESIARTQLKALNNLQRASLAIAEHRLSEAMAKLSKIEDQLKQVPLFFLFFLVGCFTYAHDSV